MSLFRFIPFLALIGCTCPEEIIPEATWTSPPLVEVCPSSPLTKAEVWDYYDVWFGFSSNYELAGIKNSDCEEIISYGLIRFREADPDYLEENDAAGVTFSYTSETNCSFTDYYTGYNEVCYATVGLPPGAPEDVVLHEIGHAYGWGHNNCEGHLMYGEWAGDNYQGLWNYN
jgi:hypothetical protein